MFPSLFRFSLTSPLLALSLAISPYNASHAAPPETVQVLVKPKARMSEVALHAVLSSKGATLHDEIPALQVRVIRVPAHAAERLLEAFARHPDVEYAEPDFEAQALATSNDPYLSSEWHLNKIQAFSAWDLTKGSTDSVVAVLDSGVLASHPDLAGRVLPGYDFVSNDTDASDDNGHGTAVAGVAAAASDNLTGVAGVSWSNPVLPVKVLGADGSGTYSGIANGIIYAADRGARVINMSLGGPSSSRTLQDAVNYAWNRQCVLIAAAGNDGVSTPSYPAACANVVAVSATNSADTRPSWSNYGSYVDVSAPGENILSLYLPNTYASWNGTSFSSPVTAGVAALMVSANPTLTNTQIVDMLLKNSDDIGAGGYDVYYGHGRVNAYRAVVAAKSYAAPDTTAPTASILSPASGSLLVGTAEVNIAGVDNVAVTSLELYLDNQLLAKYAAASGSFSLNTTAYADGAHTLTVRAFDAAGNVGTTSASVTIQNAQAGDSIAPVVAIVSPADGYRITSKTLKIQVSANDNVAVTKLAVYVDGMLLGTSTGSASASFNWNTMKVSKGAHTLQAYAYDAAGNVGASPLLTIYK